MRPIGLLRTIVFLSAFLLFQIELIVGKTFLPHFGGSYLVWGACLVFFQACLLAGYQYSCFVLENIGIRRYRYYHMILILLPLLSFPGRLLPAQYVPQNIPFVFDVFWQLFATIGLVFFVLSTSSVLYQSWLASSDLKEKDNPYALFAVSNLGSFLALLSYPFYFELFFDLHLQQYIWRGLYIILILLQLAAVKMISVPLEEKQKLIRTPTDSKKMLLWLLYGASGVVMFLSATNIMTAEIAPVPLLWVIPLAIYLLSFVLNFKSRPYSPLWIETKSHFIIGFGVVFYFLMNAKIFPVLVSLMLMLCFTFLMCLLAQRKLYQHKPEDIDELPRYYFIISFGGFLGGVIVSWILPLVTTAFLEYFGGFLLISIGLLMEQRTKGKAWYMIYILFLISFLISWPVLFPKNDIFSIGSLLVLFVIIFSKLRKYYLNFILSLVVIISLEPIIKNHWSAEENVYESRNYYGTLSVLDSFGVRWLLHGTTIHGAQYLDEAKKPIPLTYYSLKSPVGEVLTSDVFNFKAIGALGVGTGTIAAYLNGSQAVDFFELDKDVILMAKKYFSFLNRSSGKISYVIGDGRLSLGKTAKNKYDLLILDAFSGDAIPVHLLTKEALELYRTVIRDNGIVLFHVSNRYINAHKALFATAFSLDGQVCYKNDKEKKGAHFPSNWVAVTWDKESYRHLINDLKWQEVSKESARAVRIWTDHYSTIIPYLDYSRQLKELKEFNLFKK
ncbi:MAG TPA: fused MFS/spermidine synthase [Candidatus Omnitrophota bacterium]|nr:fused MFS/spermidine synthase [Candidatus Omnitrophota bacterium]